ncbi:MULTISPECIES: aldehyde dehydrogenase family protein [Rhizobium]|nr:aldehyde dehydrogenase family protein [Rhizobium leguminosarum]TAV60899.1 aldehyde dehydrogenase family protein [Rhizobium leguminosarum]TAV71956.1 aldehyde dehydrogenase family protein [Rhizobium leguminosarum]TAY69654.1 aldehyde dehydrogenase family protein [Rhizobium leguminosarum]TAZ54903.1 aldehyde dehydrogenase family protein [Rhizobium ruizarguesonis]
MPAFQFDTFDEAIKNGNQTEYGLAGAVWSQKFPLP